MHAFLLEYKVIRLFINIRLRWVLSMAYWCIFQEYAYTKSSNKLLYNRTYQYILWGCRGDAAVVCLPIDKHRVASLQLSVI